MRRYYGVHETQFENYFREARAFRDRPVKYVPADCSNAVFDNVVYRLNLATAARRRVSSSRTATSA